MALAFMAVITVGLTGLAISIVKGNAKSRDMSTAVQLAQDQLERVRNTAYTQVVSGTFPDDSPATGFQRTTSIAVDTPIRGMKRVTVTVTWGGGSVREELLVGQ